MKKKIIIGVIIIVAIGAGVIFWMNSKTHALSPAGSVQSTSGDLEVSIDYCRPSVRGRLIFGTAEKGALLPYGKYWRLGANEPTTISFNRDVTFNGQSVKAGKYRMYAIPGADAFEIALNTEIGFWGAEEPDYSKDLLRTKVPVQNINPAVEQFTINLKPTDQGMDVEFNWADIQLVLPVNR